MPTARRKRLFGFAVPGAIVGLLFAGCCIPYPGDMVPVIWLSVACVVIGAALGAFLDRKMDRDEERMRLEDNQRYRLYQQAIESRKRNQ